jgi:hypothetical protein
MLGLKITAVVIAAGMVLGCESEPLEPTSSSYVTSQASENATNLPFRGTITANESFVIAGSTLISSGTADGTATQLGRFTATYYPIVDLLTGAATGTFTIIAANGDQLSGTFTGQGVPAGSGASSITEHMTITGGTGRFAAATGAFTIQRILTFTGPTAASSTGTFDGEISLNQ